MIEKLLTFVLLLALSACGVSRPPGADSLPVAAAPSPRIESDPVDTLRLFEPHEYRSHGQVLPYRLFTPRREASMKKYPLVVFLHGASSSGTDNHRQLTGSGFWGTSLWLSEDVQGEHPSFVLAPQANPARGEAWVRRWRAPEAASADPEPLELVMELVDRLVKELPIDPARLYVTGLSMGGFGAWSAITRYPHKFAAAVPVCGGGDPSTVLPNQTAVWAFHGAGDLLVSPRRSREMVEAFRDAGAEAKYTEYPDLDHNSWERAYQEPDLARWLFSQHRP